MKDMTVGTLIAVFEEMFGGVLFWLMVAVAAAVTIDYFYVLIRDRAVSWRKFLWAQLSMPFGAVAAVLFVLWVNKSHISDLGGPIDVIVFLGIAAMGAIGLAVLVYTAESLIWPAQDRYEEK